MYGDQWAEARMGRPVMRTMKVDKPHEVMPVRRNNFPVSNRGAAENVSPQTHNFKPRSTDDSGINYRSGKFCSICNRNGHFSQDCRARIGSVNRPSIPRVTHSENLSRDIKCYRCGLTGHYSRQCPRTDIKQSQVSALSMVIPDRQTQDVRSYEPDDTTTYSDNRSKHEPCRETFFGGSDTQISEEVEQYVHTEKAMLADTKNVLPWVEGYLEDGTSVSTLRDTGCTSLMIRRSLVKDSELLVHHSIVLWLMAD
jgi:hypothetical protein